MLTIIFNNKGKWKWIISCFEIKCIPVYTLETVQNMEAKESKEVIFSFCIIFVIHYDYGESCEHVGKIFLNDIILNIINNYDIYYFTYNNNTIKNINY